MKPMAFGGWFFKGGSTWNRRVLMGDFSKGGVHETDGFWWVVFQRREYTKPMGFDGFWNVFLLLLKIKRPGRLFRQIRYFKRKRNKIITVSSSRLWNDLSCLRSAIMLPRSPTWRMAESRNWFPKDQKTWMKREMDVVARYYTVSILQFVSTENYWYSNVTFSSVGHVVGVEMTTGRETSVGEIPVLNIPQIGAKILTLGHRKRYKKNDIRME